MLDRRHIVRGAAGLLAVASWPRTVQAQARTPVRVGFVPVIGAAPLFVMNGLGWAREAGLDLSLTKFESGPPAIQALASGTLDVLFVGIAPVAVARAKGLPVKVVAACGVGGSGFAVQAPLGTAFAEAGGKARDAFAAFKARTGRPAKLGVLPPGGTPMVALRYWLKRENVAPEDLTFVSMGIEAVQQAMLTGAVDGGTVLEPSLTILASRKPDATVIAYAPQMYPKLPGVVISATEPFLASRPDAVVALLKLAGRARELIGTDPGRAAEPIQAALAGGLVSADIYEQALRSPAVSFVLDPRQIMEVTRDSLLFEVEIGDFPAAPPIDGLFDTAAYDRAFPG